MRRNGNATKAVKAFWTILVSVMVLSSSVPFSMAEMELTSCEDMQPSTVMYCSLPLDMSKKTEDVMCCGDGMSFQYEYDGGCTEGYSAYDLNYCTSEPDLKKPNYESCGSLCQGMGHDDYGFDYGSMRCECSTETVNPDYQYFFYSDKKSVGNIKLDIADTSKMKRMSFVENLIPGISAKAGKDMRGMDVGGSTAFIVHGDGERLNMKRADGFKEQVTLVPVDECDQLVAMMTMSTGLMLDNNPYSNDASDDFDLEYAKFTSAASIAVFKSLLKAGPDGEALLEDADSVVLLRASTSKNLIPETVTQVDAMLSDVSINKVGTYASLQDAITTMVNDRSYSRNWGDGKEGYANILFNEDGKAAAVVDLNNLAYRTDGSVFLPMEFNNNLLIAINGYDDSLIDLGVTAHSHPNGVLALSVGDVTSEAYRLIAEEDNVRGFAEFLKETGIDTESEAWALELEQDAVTKPIIKAVIDPNTGNMRMFFMKKEGVLSEFDEYNYVKDSFMGDLDYDAKLSKYRSSIPKNDVIDFEVFMGNNKNAASIGNMVRIIDTQNEMVDVASSIKNANYINKMARLTEWVIMDASKSNTPIDYQKIGKIMEYIEFKHEISKMNLETLKMTTRESPAAWYSTKLIESDIQYTDTLINKINSFPNVEYTMTPENLELARQYHMEWEGEYLKKVSESQRDVSFLLDEFFENNVLKQDDVIEFKGDVDFAYRTLMEKGDDMLFYGDQKYVLKGQNAITEADNSVFRDADAFVNYFEIGDILVVAGLVTKAYAMSVDNLVLARMSDAALTAGVLTQMASMGISVYSVVSMAAEIGVMSTLVTTAVGLVTGVVIGIVVSLMVIAVVSAVICMADPSSYLCGCSVSANYDKPVIEMGSTTVARGEPVNYVIYGMQFCDPQVMLGMDSSMYNLFIQKDGFVTGIVGTSVDHCYFEDGSCCEGTVSFDMESGEHEIYGGLTWNPQSGFVATTDPVTLTIFDTSTSGSIIIRPGWNMISIPYTEAETKFFLREDPSFPPLSGPNDCMLAEKAWHYNGMDYETVPVKSMEGGVGYWVYSYNLCEIGYSLTSDSQAANVPGLGAGWNHISVPPEGLSKLDMECDMVEDPKTWDTSDHTWIHVDEMVPRKSYLVDCYPEKA